MPLKNFTTTVDAVRTVAEIQVILAKHGARKILMEYDGEVIEALSFTVATRHGEVGFRVPVNPDAVLEVFKRQRVEPRFQNRTHAIKVAWRIAKDWIDAQMAIVETGMVQIEEVFLPYMKLPQGRTLYQAMADKGFYLTQGREEETASNAVEPEE